MLSDGSIRNSYEVRLRNKEHAATIYRLSVQGEGTEDLLLAIEGLDGDIIEVPADQTQERRLYLTAPVGTPLAMMASQPIQLTVENLDQPARATVKTVFHGRGD